MDETLRGLRVYRASRLEALVAPLESLLDAWLPEDLLAPQTVLAAHPGIQRWLTRELARRRGAADVVANLDVILPGTWLESEMQTRAGQTAQPAYRREVLRWRVLDALDAIEDPSLSRYLDGADRRRRFQLADRIAALYARYLVYRPDWLAAWEQGRSSVPTRSFLAPLWRRLRTDIAGAHRGELMRSWFDARRRAAPESVMVAPLHVFGLSHLPPPELALLRAEARHRLVCLYFPDPCVEFWAGLGDDRSRLQRLRQFGPDGEGERELQSLGHPLLAAWGRMGQQFGLGLLDGEGEDGIAADISHIGDYAMPSPQDRLLQRLQHGIRRLAADAPLPPEAGDLRQDASLRVHGCHTRVRELEVLRDALLDALAADTTLKPGDIAVMAPDIAAYAPLLPALFGTAADARADLPYHCADLATRRAHPLFDAFLALLHLPTTRIGAAEVLDLLQTGAVMRALGLDDEGLEVLRRWLTDARVAWGLDAGTRRQLGLPGYDEHSFAWGMARLVAGHVYGDDVPEAAAAQVGLWPVGGVQGVAVTALGALDRLLGQISRWCEAATTPQAGSQWCSRLDAIIAELFVADPDDADEVAALGMLRACIRGLREQMRLAERDPELDHGVLCELIDEALARVPERQPFLLGAITFCGMVPQRSIPFRMIAVLGLNDGEFPRASGDDGLDLMQRYPRIGDRDTRSDDRYLFLETLMAARDRLHLSYHHEGVNDGRPRNPAAPLAELMAFLDARTDASRPWFVAHPLQPFDARYFDGRDPRLYSFSAAFASMVQAERATDDRFVAGPNAGLPEADPLANEAATVSLSRLLRYFRDPAAQLLRDRLRLRLDALEDEAPEAREPLDARPDPFERIPQRLLMSALERGDANVPATAPDWLRLSGRLPAGALGHAAYRRAAEQADALLAIARAHPALAAGLPPRQPVAVDLRVGAWQVQGTITRVHATAEQWLLFDAYPGKRLAQLDFRQRIPLFIEWAVLRLAYPHQPLQIVVLTEPDKKNDPARWDLQWNALDARTRHADLEARLAALIAFWHQSPEAPLQYLPKTAWAAASSTVDKRRDAMRAAWQSGYAHTGERDYAPGYAAWLARGVDLTDPDAADARTLIDAAMALQRLLDLDTIAEVTP